MSESASTVGVTPEENNGSPLTDAKEASKAMSGQVQEAGREIGKRAKDRVRQEIDRRSSDAGSQVRSVADGLRQASADLRKEGNPSIAGVADTAADKIDGVATYLTESDADRLLRDLDTLARRQPYLVTAGAFVLGILGARFLKASSPRR
jgi:IMP dehydrogenase/GMP reductase